VFKKKLVKGKPGHLDDWNGNNIALSCPVCGKVYIVSGQHDRNGKECPNCGKSKGFVDIHGTEASIECYAPSPFLWKSN
jgi:rubrerythrin